MARFVFFLFTLLSSASADYPANGNGLIQKDHIKAKAVTPDAADEEVVADETIDGGDAIEQAKEDIANGGEEPPPTPHHTLYAYIQEVLMPRAEATKKMLEKTLSDAQKKIGHCEVMTIEAAKPSRENAEANLARQERKLAMCLRVKNGETIKEEEFCEEWHASAKNFNPRTLDYAKGNLKTYENILKTYYDFYPKFMKEEAKCREMIAIMHSQDKHCSFRVGEIRKLFCAMKENATKVCHDYDNCYAGAKADFEWTVDKAEKLQVHTLKTWKALKCFMDASMGFHFARTIDDTGGENSETKGFKCDPSKYKTTTLDIDFAKIWRGPEVIPEKAACSKFIVTKTKDAHPSWCSWEPATTATTTLSVASQGPSGGPATDQNGNQQQAALIQDSANLDTNPFSKVEEYLADAESVLKKMQQ